MIERKATSRRAHIVGASIPPAEFQVTREDVSALTKVLSHYGAYPSGPTDRSLPDIYLPVLALIRNRFSDLATVLSASWQDDAIMLSEQEIEIVSDMQLGQTYRLETSVTDLSRKQGRRHSFDLVSVESLVINPEGGASVIRITNRFVILDPH